MNEGGEPTDTDLDIDIEYHFNKHSRRSLSMQLWKELEGNRTYIIGFLLALWGVLGFALGRTDVQGMITILLEAAALLGIRASIQNLLKN